MKAFWSRVLIFVLIFALLQPMFPAFENVVAEGDDHPFSGGSGTADDPYQIETAEQLNNIRGEYLSEHYILANDIDLSDFQNWEPIGTNGDPFMGTFDGNGYVITNLSIDRNEQDQGLFGNILNSTINQLQLLDADVRGQINVGGIAGRIGDSVISDVVVTGHVTGDAQVGGVSGMLLSSIILSATIQAEVSGDIMIGGITGLGNSSSFESVFVYGTVSGNEYVGGIVGNLMGNNFMDHNFVAATVSADHGAVGGLIGAIIHRSILHVNRSASIGDVQGGAAVGGLIGGNDTRRLVMNDVYVLGAVEGTHQIGGLMGFANNSTGIENDLFIRNAYAAGKVTGELHVGGLFGITSGRGATVTTSNSFWDIEATQQTSSGAQRPEGKTTEQMQQQATFETVWDFDDTWMIVEGETYPVIFLKEGTHPVLHIDSLATRHVTVDNNDSITISGSVDHVFAGGDVYVKYSIRNHDGDPIEKYTRQVLTKKLNVDDTEVDFSGTLMIPEELEVGQYLVDVYVKTIHAAGRQSDKHTINLEIHEKPEIARVDLVTTNNSGEPIPYFAGTWTNQAVQVQVQFEDDVASAREHALIKDKDTLSNDDWRAYHDNIRITETGKYTLYVRTGNPAEYMQTEIIENIWLDLDADPSPAITLSEDGWTNAEKVRYTVIPIDDTFSDLDQIEVQIGMGKWQSYVYAQHPQVSGHVDVEGETVIRARTVDEAGNVSHASEKTVKIDHTPPTAPKIQPVTINWTNQPVKVTLSGASDKLSGIERVEYRIGSNGSWKTYSSPFTIEEDGETYLYARSIDRAGNVTVKSNHTVSRVRIDQQVPRVTVDLTRADGTVYESGTWVNQSVTANATFRKDGTDIISRQYSTNQGRTWRNVTGELTLNTHGIHHIWYRAIDEAGNETISRRQVNIDVQPPSVPALHLSHEGWTNTGVTVTLNATDSGSGVDYYEYRINSSNDWIRHSTSLVIHQDGETTLTARAIDQVGNVGEASEPVTIQIDRTVPTLSLHGDAQLTVEADSLFTDPGATATHPRFGNLNDEIVVTGSVDTSVPGAYTLTYSVTDPAGNSTTVTRNIEVLDRIIPIGERRSVSAGHLWLVQDSNASIQMPQDLPEGTVVSAEHMNVKETQHGGLKLAGDVFTFNFEYPNGEHFVGEFILTLSYNDDADPNRIGIYYYNEENDEWEYRGGEVNTEDQTISITVPHFSTYGVFESEVNETEAMEADVHEVEGDKEKEVNTLNALWWLVLFILLAVVVVLFIWFYRKRKQQVDS